jgi:hypothetical protein
MKKTLILILIFCASFAKAQWQEITDYGKVKDFLYIDENLWYVWGDTNYIVENGKARAVADFGFYKKDANKKYLDNQADFVKGTRIGFKFLINYSNIGSLDVYRTTDGGITWKIFTQRNFPNYEIICIPTAIDSVTVIFEGVYRDLNKQDFYDLPLMKFANKAQFEFIYSKVHIPGKVTDGHFSVLKEIFFIDSLYGIKVLEPNAISNKYNIIRTTDGGRNFYVIDSIYYNQFGGELIQINKKILLMNAPWNLLISTDSGLTWASIRNLTYTSGKTDTLITNATIIKDNVLYLRENKNFNYGNPTISILYSIKINNTSLDSVIIKPTQNIICYETNTCYMYKTSFYRNIDPVQYPLSDKELKYTLSNKPQLLYGSENFELTFPNTTQNNQYQLLIYDLSGKLILKENIPNQLKNYEFKLNDNLSQGLYVINLRSNTEVFSFKLFKN